MGLVIHFLTNDGSPLGVTAKILWGLDGSIGIGGSEYLMITLCEEWTKAGHNVVLFNNPKEFGASSFEQRAIGSFNIHEPRDILINFRSPNAMTALVSNCKKIWLSTDQMSVGDYRAFAGHVDKIVVISPRHAEYFKSEYGIQHAIVIDIPVRVQDYEEVRQSERVEKIPKHHQIAQWADYLQSNPRFAEWVQKEQMTKSSGLDDAEMDDATKKAYETVRKIADTATDMEVRQVLQNEIAPLAEAHKQLILEKHFATMDDKYGKDWHELRDEMSALSEELPQRAQNNPTIDDIKTCISRRFGRRESSMPLQRNSTRRNSQTRKQNPQISPVAALHRLRSSIKVLQRLLQMQSGRIT